MQQEVAHALGGKTPTDYHDAAKKQLDLTEVCAELAAAFVDVDLRNDPSTQVTEDAKWYVFSPHFPASYSVYLDGVSADKVPFNEVAIGTHLFVLRTLLRSTRKEEAMLCLRLYSNLLKWGIFDALFAVWRKQAAGSYSLGVALLMVVCSANLHMGDVFDAVVPYAAFPAVLAKHEEAMFEVLTLAAKRAEPGNPQSGAYAVWCQLFRAIGGCFVATYRPEEVYFVEGDVGVCAKSLRSHADLLLQLPERIIFRTFAEFGSEDYLSLAWDVILSLSLFDRESALRLCEEGGLIERASDLFSDCIEQGQIECAFCPVSTLIEILAPEKPASSTTLEDWNARSAAIEAKWKVPVDTYVNVLRKLTQDDWAVYAPALGALRFYRRQFSEENEMKLRTVIRPLIVVTVLTSNRLNRFFPASKGLIAMEEWHKIASDFEAEYDKWTKSKTNRQKLGFIKVESIPSFELVKRFVVAASWSEVQIYERWAQDKTRALPSPCFSAGCCASCGTKKKIQKCSRCRLVEYCGQKCQAQDWPRHKGECSSKNST